MLEEQAAQQALRGQLGLRITVQPAPVPVPACDITVSVDADAFATNCGASGDASVSYQNTCKQSCSINSYVYAEATTCAGQHLSATDSCYDDGVNISCSSATGKKGVNNCYSYASAYIYCNQLGGTPNYYLYTDDTNTNCTTSPWIACACPVFND
jgi:hypothetical protein